MGEELSGAGSAWAGGSRWSTYRVSRWYRVLTAVCLLVPVGAVPLVVALAVRDGVGPTLFVAAWVVGLLAVLAQVWCVQPDRIVIEGQVVEFVPRIGHRTRRVDASSLRAVRCFPMSQYLRVTWDGGGVMMPRHIDGLDDLLRDLIALEPDLEVRISVWR